MVLTYVSDSAARRHTYSKQKTHKVQAAGETMGTGTCGYGQTMLQPDFPSAPPPPMLKTITPEESSLSLLVFHRSCPTASPHPSWLPPRHSCIP